MKCFFAKKFLSVGSALSLMWLGPLVAEGVIVPVYDMEGVLTESGLAEPNFLDISPDTSRPITHYDVVTSLQRAVTDDAVSGVVVEIDQTALSLAQVYEMRRLLEAIVAVKKEVWVYTDYLDFRVALIGSVATDFVMNPEGNVMMTGLFSEQMYFKGMLDKAGLQVDVVHIGDFKSAGENLYRTGPSEPAKLQSEELLDSLYSSLVTEIAKGAGITREALQGFINQGMVTAKDAQKLGLVDRLENRTDLVEELQDKLGEEAYFDPTYVQNGYEEPEVAGFFDLMKLMFSSGSAADFEEPYIAVVAFEGAISLASITPTRDEVIRLVEDEMCEALVLRVDSPGGSALASDILWEAIDEFKATDRPVVVSMGSVAASGGYYISAGADHIFAEATTITGSIGVVGMKIAMGGTLEKLGISTHQTKRGEHADLYNTTEVFSETERKLVKQSMEQVYGVFKGRIIEGRGERIQGDLEKLAGGRVYSGHDALRIGLVDELGGLGEAIDKAMELAEIAKDEEVKSYLFPEPKGAFEMLFQQESEPVNDHFITLQNRSKEVQVLEEFLLSQGGLALLPEDKRASLRDTLKQLRAIQSDRIQLIGGGYPTF